MQKYILLVLIATDLLAMVPQSADARTRHRYYYRRGSLAWTQRSAYGLYGTPPAAAIPGLRRGRVRPAFGPHDLVK
jgi:hypothetical protein